MSNDQKKLSLPFLEKFIFWGSTRALGKGKGRDPNSISCLGSKKGVRQWGKQGRQGAKKYRDLRVFFEGAAAAAIKLTSDSQRPNNICIRRLDLGQGCHLFPCALFHNGTPVPKGSEGCNATFMMWWCRFYRNSSLCVVVQEQMHQTTFLFFLSSFFWVSAKQVCISLMVRPNSPAEIKTKMPRV